MKWIRNIAAVLVILGAADSCIKQPEYSNVPHIDLKSIVAYKTGTSIDSIVFKLYFKDGDGNLGLGPDETAIYLPSGDSIDVNAEPFYFVYDTVQNKILGYVHNNDLDLTIYGSNLSYVDYHAKITRASFDTLPEFGCDHYQKPSGTSGGQRDTVYYANNMNGQNIFIEAYYKYGTNYILYDPNVIFTDGICRFIFSNLRFPILSSDPGKQSPLEGTITYKYSSFILNDFLGRTVKFRIYITDRTGIPDQNTFTGIRMQRSNVIETEDYKF